MLGALSGVCFYAERHADTAILADDIWPSVSA
jgi:hypothetical protein